MNDSPKQAYGPIDVTGLKTFSMDQRHHKASLEHAGALPEADVSCNGFIESLPDYLGAKALKGLSQMIATAYKNERPVVFAMGAHVIKVGCSPIVIDLIERGIVKGVVFNGAGGIHDFEMAAAGQTSEDVGANLKDGRFGMTEEAPEIMSAAAKKGQLDGTGLAYALGALINERDFPNKAQSIFAIAQNHNILSALHVAVGTDTIHMHDNADGCAIGAASMIDFRRVCNIVSQLGDGGVWLNIGSAVILPEVFLKAVSVARNLGADLDKMVTGNLDMIRHYRVEQNILSRPVEKGNSYAVTGHHEILLPLLRMMILQQI